MSITDPPRTRLCENSGNPTHGAVGGSFRCGLPREDPHLRPGIPPTAVGGSFRCGLPREDPHLRPGIPPTAVGGSFKSSLQSSVQGFSFFDCPFRRAARESDDKTKGGAGSLCRLDLNDPPTPVGGIQRSGRVAFACRLDLKRSPTPVGGIPRLFAQSPL